VSKYASDLAGENLEIQSYTTDGSLFRIFVSGLSNEEELSLDNSINWTVDQD